MDVFACLGKGRGLGGWRVAGKRMSWEGDVWEYKCSSLVTCLIMKTIQRREVYSGSV